MSISHCHLKLSESKMLLKMVLSVFFILNVHCRPFGVKWRLGKLEEKHFKEMTELREGLSTVVEMINNNTCACGANNGITEYGKVQKLNMSDKTVYGLYDDIARKASETLSGIKRAFVEEKGNIRKTVEETKHEHQVILSSFKNEMDKVRNEIQDVVNEQLKTLQSVQLTTEKSIRQTVADIRLEYEETVSGLKDKMNKLRNDIYDDINEQLKTLQNVQLIADSNTGRINRLSNSAANVVDDVSMTRTALNVNQDSIIQLTNTVLKLASNFQMNSVFLSLLNQNMKWQCHAGSCYFIGKGATWNESKLRCNELGAKLAEVESEEENNFLVEFAAKQGISEHGVFLGATDRDKEGVWKWDGSKRKTDETFNNFKGSEPNGGRRENCLELHRHVGWAWNDMVCSQRLGFICEIIESEDM